MRAAHQTLESVRGQLETEEAKSAQLAQKIHDTELEAKQNVHEINARVEQSSAENTDRFKKQLQEFE